MALSSGPGMIAFTTMMLYIIILSGLVVGLARAGIYWQETGDWKPTVEASVGQVLYWDSQIYTGIQYLKDDAFISALPPSFQREFKQFIIKQIVFYLVMFLIVGYGLYKFGNWIAGHAAFDPTTDLMIIVIIIGFFALAEFTYGWLMYDELVVPYRGLAELLKPSTWSAMLGSTNASQVDAYQQYISQNAVGSTNLSSIINLTGGG